MADKYVSTAGSDGNSGNGPGAGDAYATINKAYENVDDGGTVWIADGT